MMKPNKKTPKQVTSLKSDDATSNNTHETMSQKIEQAILYIHISIGFASHNMDIVKRGVTEDSAMMHKTQRVHKIRHIRHRAHEPRILRNTTTNILLLQVVLRPGLVVLVAHFPNMHGWCFFVIMSYVVSMIFVIMSYFV